MFLYSWLQIADINVERPACGLCHNPWARGQKICNAEPQHSVELIVWEDLLSSTYNCSVSHADSFQHLLSSFFSMSDMEKFWLAESLWFLSICPAQIQRLANSLSPQKSLLFSSFSNSRSPINLLAENDFLKSIQLTAEWIITAIISFQWGGKCLDTHLENQPTIF